MNAATTLPDLDYKIKPLSQISIRPIAKAQKTLHCEVRVGKSGPWLATTGRFWTSFMAKFGFSDSMFRYFEHQEVLDRICERQPEVELRFCVDAASGRALAVSNPARPIIAPRAYMEVVEEYEGERLSCHEGVVMTTYTPPSGERSFKIGPDSFANRYVMEVPLDGYGKPSIYLSMLRQVCQNGAVAYAPSFRQDVTIGDDPQHGIRRALESFDSDEGYSSVRQRFERAQLSPASLWECLQLYRAFKKTSEAGTLVKAYEKVVGDVYGEYGVASLDGLTEKKLRLLPAKCKVYDLINLATEASTHHLKGPEAKALQAWLGVTIAEEYDLEGTADRVGDHDGILISERRKPGRGPSRKSN